MEHAVPARQQRRRQLSGEPGVEISEEVIGLGYVTSATGACNVEGATKVALQGAKASQLDLEAAGAALGSPTTPVTGKGLTEIMGPMVKIN